MAANQNIAVDGDIHNQPKADQYCHHGGAAVGDEWQRNTDDGCQASDHRNIYEEIEEEHSRNAHAD